MAKEIRPLNLYNESTSQEEIFFPATTSDAVVHPTRRESLTDIIDENDSDIKEGAVYDVSAKNATGGTLATYASLSAILESQDINTLIPTSRQVGGLEIKFKNSSTGKYESWKLLSSSWSTTLSDWRQTDIVDILNVTDYNSGATYSTFANAIAAVPSDLRKVGLQITYKDSNGDWLSYQFVGSSTSTWTTATDWVVPLEYQNGVFDISKYNASGSTLATYASLTAALGTNGANVPAAYRRGGMTVKYVDSSDNKYVQYFLTKNEWSTDEDDWEKTNLEEEVNQLDQDTTVLENIVSGDGFEFKDNYYWRVDRNQEKSSTNCAYCRIRVKAGEKFLITGSSTSSVAPFISLIEDDSTVHTSSETSGNRLQYTAEYDGYLIVNNLAASTVPSLLEETSDRFNGIEGRLTSAEGRLTSAEGRLTSAENELKTKIGVPEIEFADLTIFKNGFASFIEGKYWNTTTNTELTDEARKYVRLFLPAGTKAKITGSSSSDSAKLLAEFPYDGTSAIISAETSVTDYEYTMTKDGYLVVNTTMSATGSYVKIISNITDAIPAEIDSIKTEIGVPAETFNLTSSDYANLWSNGLKIFSSNLSSYNGFLIPVKTGTRYFWTATLYKSTALSAYPVSGESSMILGEVGSGFIATSEMKYLLLSLELANTTSMTLTTNGYGLEHNSVQAEKVILDNSIAEIELVLGTLNGDGRIISGTNRIVTKNFIDLSKNILDVSGAFPLIYVYYDKNYSVLYYDQSYNRQHVTEAAYCRLVFDSSATEIVVHNDFFGNPQHTTYKNITNEGFQINNGLESTSASGVIMSYDKSSGIVAAIYAGAWLEYGERGDEITIALFPLMQPTNVKYVTMARKNESMGNGHTFAGSPDVNIISLGNRVWRAMVLNYRGTNPRESYWLYRDYHYDTNTLDDAVEIKMSYGNELLSLSTENRKSIINSISGLTDTASSEFVTISSSFDYHSDEGQNGTYYGCITGYGYTDSNPDDVYVLLFSSTDDMETLVPFAVFPYSSQFEASCIKIGTRFYCIGRQNTGYYHTGYSDDDGATWTYKAIVGTNNRPRLYSVGGVPMWCYGVTSTTSKMRNRGKIAIAHSTDPEEVTKVLEGDWGLVYFDIFIKNEKMFVSYSCAPLTLDTDNGEDSIEGKDCVRFVTLLNP